MGTLRALWKLQLYKISRQLMHKTRTLLTPLSLISLLLITLLMQATPAFAQLGIVGVQPNTVTGLTPVELVVTGTEFADGASVLIEGFGALATTFVSDTVLRALLPAGIDPGTYTITVVNPDSNSVSLADALRVLAPTATTTQPAAPSATPATRPVVVVSSYSAGKEPLTPGQQYTLVIKLNNSGGQVAQNIVAVFTPGDLVPRETGGVIAVDNLDPGDSHKISQPVTASWELIGKSYATVVMTVSYTDLGGTAYTETFNLTIPVVPPKPGAFYTATPTPTLTPVPPKRPQLIVVKYTTDVETLQPGTQFTLAIQVQNKGNADAHQVSMIIGGGSSSGGSPQGTPETGGVSGGSSDLGNFAPVSSSNVQFLGDMLQAQAMDASTMLIVNATATPGAFPLKISFAYSDDKGAYYTDDQVVTMLVYSLPQVAVNYYRPIDPLFMGQPGVLPLQIVNIGRKSAVLGNMTVTGQGQFSNNQALVGPLDVGGYYTLDTTVIPEQSGPLQLLVTINYLDDFSQPRVISSTLTADVLEAPPTPLPGEGGDVVPPSQPQTFWQKAWRFVLGLLGLNSGEPTLPGAVPPGEVPPGKPVPFPNTKG
jgi:hypothetical protein